uniref:RHS repeat-associated core domain-containing protein n=1 Tax=Endozoicomonas sp. ALB115 TaxID=3403074 RepID=UPI003BB5CF9C
SLGFNIRFPGQYADSESGLYYNRFRDYAPGSGRYVQSDPIGLQGGLNTFGYVYQNPLNYSDPDGQLPVFVVLGLINGSISVAATLISSDCASQGDLLTSFAFGFATGVLGGVGSGLNAAKFSTALLGRDVPKASGVIASVMAGMNGSMAGAADAAGSAMTGSGCGCDL